MPSATEMLSNQKLLTQPQPVLEASFPKLSLAPCWHGPAFRSTRYVHKHRASLAVLPSLLYPIQRLAESVYLANRILARKSSKWIVRNSELFVALLNMLLSAGTSPNIETNILLVFGFLLRVQIVF